METQFNPAHLVEGRIAILFNGENKFSIPGLNKYTAFLQFNNLGIKLISFGNDYYRENLLGLGWGLRVAEKLALGLDVSLLNYWIEDGDNELSYTLKIGGKYGGGPVRIYLWLNNINLPRFKGLNRLPVNYEVLTDFSGSPQLSFYFAVRGVERDFPFFNFGFHYHPHKAIKILLGVNTEPLMPEYGMTMQFGKLEVRYSGNSHRQLGLTHSLGLGFQIR